MREEFHHIKKHWLVDIFWKRKQQAIKELKKGSSPPESAPSAESESDHAIHHVERVLEALEKRGKARRWLFIKFISAIFSGETNTTLGMLEH